MPENNGQDFIRAPYSRITINDWRVDLSDLFDETEKTLETPAETREGTSMHSCKFCGRLICSDGDKIDYHDPDEPDVYACSTCRSSKLTVCDKCGKWVKRGGRYSMITLVGVKQRWCLTCVENNPYRRCAYCSTRMEIADGEIGSRRSDGRVVYRNRAYLEPYVMCLECASHQQRCNCQGGWYNPNRGETRCRSCVERESTRTVLLPYSTKPSPKFYNLPFEKKGRRLYMGVELEIDDGQNGQTLVEKLGENFLQLYCKRDGSLSEKGIEIVTHPATLLYHKAEMNWPKITKMCREYKYVSSDAQRSCGLHVHFNRDFVNHSSVFCLKLAAFVHMHKTEVEKIARRTSNHYSAYYDINGIFTLKDRTGFEGRGCDRYDAVNFANRETIEWRVFRGTLSVHKIYAALEFVDATTRYINGIGSVEVLKHKSSWDGFVKFVASDKKSYGCIFEMMKEFGLTGGAK